MDTAVVFQPPQRNFAWAVSRPDSSFNASANNKILSTNQHGSFTDRASTSGHNAPLSSRGGVQKMRRHSGNSSASSLACELAVRNNITDFLGQPGGGRDPDGFVRRSRDEDCIKCMLRIKHDKCEAHKYIRVGGGYRHSYWYVKMVLEELEFQRQQEDLRRRRLEAIAEGGMRAIKTYVRTKSGRLIEKIIFVSDEDYNEFRRILDQGGDPSDLLRKYMSKADAKGLESFEKEEQKAITTWIRTKSGRLIEKVVYVSKEEFEAIQRGDVDANKILAKLLGLKDGEKLEGWKETKMRTITTKIRTKSGRIIEKTIMISEEDYKKLQEGGDLNSILGKYMSLDKGAKLEGWEKKKPHAMKVVKTWIRTKSGRLIEKTILMTEEEFKEFQKSGGDPNFLKKFIKLKEGESIDRWEKSSTVYEASEDEGTLKGKVGQRVTDKDGNVYEYVTDPITGKVYKKRVGNLENDKDGNLAFRTKDGRIITEKDIAKRKAAKAGKRDKDSDGSEYSYQSYVSAGGTRHVKRRKKLADGGRADAESYHSSQDEEGAARRRQRRRERKHGPNSAHSYYSVVSAGGTRHVRRRKKNADGTYAKSESYHSDDSADFQAAEKNIKARKKNAKEKKVHGEDSDHSYYSEVSAGGTRTRKRRQRIRDEHGNVIGYGQEEDYSSSEDGVGGRRKGKKGNKPRREHGDDSDHSYYSEVSVGGTHHRKRRLRVRDKDGNIIGHGKVEDYSSPSDSDTGKGGKKKKKADSESDVSYFSETSVGGTRHIMQRKRIRDEEGNVIGYGKKKEYQPTDDTKSMISVSDGKGGRIRIPNPAKKGKAKGKDTVFSDATTDSDIVAAKLANMTEEEKIKYLAERAQRVQEREKARREKYGDKYDAMVKENKEKKEKAKSMVTYGKGEGRFKKDAEDNRGIGLAHDDYGGKKGGRKGKDGNDADSESERSSVDSSGQKVKKKIIRTKSGTSIEIIRDKDGNIIKEIRRDKNGNIIVTEFDKDGNVISTKHIAKKGGADEKSDDGDYFEVGPDGKIRLKAGKQKIDLSKLSKEDLRKLGIDPNMSQADIMRALKAKFGDDINVIFKGGKIGTKHIDEYSHANTDDLADDSDLDIDTLKGIKRIRVIMKRGGQALLDHMKRVIENSRLQDVGQDLEERNSSIDFLAAYRLVDPQKIELYAKAFIVEDADDMDEKITYRAARIALEGVNTIAHITEKQMDYVMKVLDVDVNTEITFRIFAVISALCERVTQMDSFCRELLEITNLIDIERKLALYRAMFYCNVPSDRDANYIKAESLTIELMAGGLNYDQQKFIMDRLEPNDFMEISFLDYLCYMPLFLSFHDNILSNPLDNSVTKYTVPRRRKASVQRDINPLGFPMKKTSGFLNKKQAQNLIELANQDIDQQQHKDAFMLNKYSKLPRIFGASSELPEDQRMRFKNKR